MELKLEQLHKQYGEKIALDHIDLTLTPGIYGILGPNGAGKSTMMNVICGNLHPTSGRVLYDGADVQTMGDAFRRKLGYMPQQQALYQTFSARTFLGYMAALRGMTQKQAQDRIPAVLELVELSEVAGQRVGSFSGGMRQRLLIAQAILADPEILIFDEPTAGLDPKQRIVIRNLIARLSAHKIIIIATHVVQDIEFISNQIVLMQDGNILQAKSRSELLDVLRGKVFELQLREADLEDASARFHIGSIAREEDSVYARVLSDKKPAPYVYQEMRPTLEDVYLWYCGG